MERLSLLGPSPKAFRQNDGEYHSDIGGVVSERYVGLTATQLAEDCFNVQKNNKHIRGKRRFRRPDKTMGAVLSRSVMSKTHRYAEVPADVPLKQRSSRLAKKSFICDPADASLPLHKISTTKATPEFYSPAAARWTQRDADLEVVQVANQESSWHMLGRLWMAELCRSSHRLLLQRADGEWFFPKFVWNDSAVLGVRAIKSCFPGSEVAFWTPDPSARYAFLVVWDAAAWRAVRYTWRSPAWQAARCSAIVGRLPPAIRAFVTSENSPEDSLLKVCAREGFFDLPRNVLLQLATFLEVTIPGGASLLDVVWALSTHLLGGDEASTLTVCGRRLAVLERQELWSEELEQMDEAIEVLDQNDRKKAKTLKSDLARCREETKEFKESFKVKAQAVRASSTTRSVLGRRKPPTAPRLRVPPFPAQNITLEFARRFIPPGASIWVGRGEGTWQGHLEPFRRCSRSWRKYGEAGALREVLRYLWRRHAALTGQTVEALPIDGLFEVEVQGGSSNVAASSGVGA